jgi:hypothetical protein
MTIKVKLKNKRAQNPNRNRAVRALSASPRGRGSRAENVRQPASGEKVRSLRAGPPNRPSMDSWVTETKEPKPIKFSVS